MLKKYLEDIYHKGSSNDKVLLIGRLYEVKGKTFLIEKYNLSYNLFFYDKPKWKGGKALIKGLVIRPKRYYYL